MKIYWELNTLLLCSEYHVTRAIYVAICFGYIHLLLVVSHDKDLCHVKLHDIVLTAIILLYELASDLTFGYSIHFLICIIFLSISDIRTCIRYTMV